MRALVTGASSGIGAEFARQLAAQGSDLVLVARQQQRLADTAATLMHEYGVHAEVLAADLTDRDDLEQVALRVASHDDPIDVLINNAGYGSYGRFADNDIDAECGQIDLNVYALTRLTHAALGQMVPAATGTIINVSSTAGAQPMPYSAVYAATKAYVTNLTHALVEELSGTGVHVMAVLPGFTRTEFHERAHVSTQALPGQLWMTPDQVVGATLRDWQKGRHICVPGIMNRASTALSSSSPAFISRKIAAIVAGRVDREGSPASHDQRQ